MSELIHLLKSELEKNDHIIEELLMHVQHRHNSYDRENLLTILDSTLKIYGRVEGLREFHADWVFIPEDRYYHALRGIICSGKVPKNSEEPFFTKKIKKGVAVGYLAVVHLFQIHSHFVPRCIEKGNNLEEELCRVFCCADEDLQCFRQFMAKIRSELNAEDAENLISGISMAYQEFDRILKRRKKKKLQN